MTETEWLTCQEVISMMHFLRYFFQGPAIELRGRKYRLFACACVRRIWNRIEDERSRNAVVIAEQLADGQATPEDVAAARSSGVMGPARKTLLRSSRMAANDVSRPLGADPTLPSLLRCVFGNPFRPVTLDPLMRTATTLNLAQAAYADRILPSGELHKDRMAVLADALEEAGCQDADILEHLRGAGLHFRGCWVVDLIVGNE
jgi:hypothetical protein